MPEGPSIVILKEELQLFKGQKVLEVSGNAKIDIQRMHGKKIRDLMSWGKHFLICFDDFYLRIHLLMFGTYRINEKRDFDPRLSLRFKKGEFNFYTCSIKLIEGKPEADYDWEVDTMSDSWNGKRALKVVKEREDEMICDVLLNQDVFAGVGNIIKNEALFIAKVHPETKVKDIPAKKLKELVTVTRDYCFDFYKWKKEFVLKQHWLAYKKRDCPRCNIPFVRTYMGKGKRLTFYCGNCQVLH